MYNIGCPVHSNCLQIITFIQNYNIQTRLTVSQTAKKPNNLFVFYEKKLQEKNMYTHYCFITQNWAKQTFTRHNILSKSKNTKKQTKNKTAGFQMLH